MPYAQLDEHNVFYEIQGRGDCILLMLPGSLGSTRLEFDRQFDGFDLEKFTLISWDAPGFGRSRPPEQRDYTDCYRRDAALLMKLMTHCSGLSGADRPSSNNNKFNLLGFSDGSRTAIHLAATFPEAVEKLILVGCTSYNSPKEKKVFELCRSVDGWSEDRRKLYEQLYGSRATLQRLWSDWIDANARLTDFASDQLPKVACPTLLLFGENDIIAPVEPHARHLKRNLTNSRIHIFAKTAHNCHQERPTEFNAIVERFLLN